MFRIIILMFISCVANADGLYVYGGINSFDDTRAQPEYNSISPLGVYGLYYQHSITKKLSVRVGVEHQSSIVLRELGVGLNGFKFTGVLKLF